MKNKKSRVGEKYASNKGGIAEIIEYYSSTNCTVRFEDGTIVKNKRFSDIVKGEVRNKNKRLCEKFITNEGYEVEIIEYFGVLNCTIKFDNGYVQYCKNYEAIKHGSIKNPYHPSIVGIGFIGDIKSNLNKNLYALPQYIIWKHMIERCYAGDYPTYKDVTVCEEWKCFENFSKWYEQNWKSHMDNTWHLDKDILIKGNKIYSPKTCGFVPQEINVLFVKNNSKRGELPIGVTKHRELFVAYCCMYNNANKIGSFKTPLEAFEAYKITKEKHIKDVAEKWKLYITKEYYKAMYAYEVEITD